jgi:hypothetical protein
MFPEVSAIDELGIDFAPASTRGLAHANHSYGDVGGQCDCRARQPERQRKHIPRITVPKRRWPSASANDFDVITLVSIRQGPSGLARKLPAINGKTILRAALGF